MAQQIRVGYPWAHGIGQDVKDCKTAQEVIEKAGLNFIVDKCQLVAKMPFSLNSENKIDEEMGDFSYGGNIYREVESAFATYRTDLNLPFGIVKSKYEVVQNMDAFNFFDDAIGKDMAEWQYAGSMGYGHKIFITAKVPVISKVGNNDPIENYLVFSNSHDGSSSVDIMFTPIRVFCTNCLAAGTDAANSHIRLRHTKTVGERINQGAQILRIACEYAKSSEELYNYLNTIPMTDLEVQEYIAKLILTKDELASLLHYDKHRGYEKIFKVDYVTCEDTGISTRKANLLKTVFESYLDGIGQQPILGTAWGAYNGITNYYSNVINHSGEKRTEALLWGSSNRKIYDALYEIVDRVAA